MEKTTAPKRYNLKPSVNPNKPKAPSVKCPECKSENIKIRSKRRYFLKAAACLVVILFCYVMFNSLRSEKDIDPVIIVGVLGSLLFSYLSVILGLYYFIKGILTMETSYRCRYCKNTFHDPDFGN
jgi:hypothetical protein